MNIELEVIRASKTANLPSDEQFQHWVNLVANSQQREGELCIRLVDEAESEELNSTYRGKDKPTNVLSFPCDLPPGFPANVLGDLAICAAVVERESIEQSKHLDHHWAHMVIHGVLHLIGFDHINDEDAEVMESLERDLLAQLHIPDPYS